MTSRSMTTNLCLHAQGLATNSIENWSSLTVVVRAHLGKAGRSRRSGSARKLQRLLVAAVQGPPEL
jgi:hypothetical protein